MWAHGLLFSGRTGTVRGDPCARVVPGRLPNKGGSCEGSKEPQSEGGARNENRPSNNGGMVRHGEGSCVGGGRISRGWRGSGVQCVHLRMLWVLIFICMSEVHGGSLGCCHCTLSYCICTLQGLWVYLFLSVWFPHTGLHVFSSIPVSILITGFLTTHALAFFSNLTLNLWRDYMT